MAGSMRHAGAEATGSAGSGLRLGLDSETWAAGDELESVIQLPSGYSEGGAVKSVQGVDDWGTLVTTGAGAGCLISTTAGDSSFFAVATGAGVSSSSVAGLFAADLNAALSCQAEGASCSEADDSAESLMPYGAKD